MFDKLKELWVNREFREISIKVLAFGFLVTLVIGGTYINRALQGENADDIVPTEDAQYVAVIDLDPPDEMEPERNAEIIPSEQAAEQQTVNIEAQAVFAESSENVEAQQEETVETWGKKLSVIMPADGKWTRTFGYGYDESWDDYRFHGGCDMILAEGSEVFAAADGEISEIYQDELWGGVIVLSHSKKMKTVYKGVNAANGLSVGDKVAAGDVIGSICAVGLLEDAMGSHLHFELWVNDLIQDPNEYME